MWGRREPNRYDLEALRANHDAAWSHFFAEHQGLIESVVSWSKWRFDYHAREEVAQGIRSELVRAIGTYDGRSSIEYFIKKVCMHRCIDEIRRQVRRNKVMVLTDQDADTLADPSLTDGPPPFHPIDAIIQHEHAVLVKRLIERLDETCRLAIRMFYVEEMSYKEMAARLGLKVDTIGARLSKCLEKLRKLAGRNPDPGEE